MIKVILIDKIRKVYEWVLSRKPIKLGNIVHTENVRLGNCVYIAEVCTSWNACQFVLPGPLEHWGIGLLFIHCPKTILRKIRL